MPLELVVILEGPHPLCLLNFVAQVVSSEVVHAVVLVEEDVGRDRVVDELDHKIDRVLGWPVEPLIVSDVPLVLAIRRIEEQRLVYIGHFFHELPWGVEGCVEVVWEDYLEDFLEVLFQSGVVMPFGPGLAEPLLLISAE